MRFNHGFTPDPRTGYGNMGIRLDEAFFALGHETFPTDGGRPCETALFSAQPTHVPGWHKGQRPMVLTMWEATVLPPTFRESLHEFETVFVPSSQNLELFGRFHRNVVLCPLGVDTKKWAYVKRTMPEDEFYFLCAGTGARKGTDLAVEAFKRAFPPGTVLDPDPRLILKSPRREDFWDDRIIHVNGYMDAEDERAVYAGAHCYLGPSRGEGFGLMPLQAIVQGLPTILTDAHGQHDYAHLGLRVRASLTKARRFLYGDAGEWWEPNLDDLVDRMRWVYDNYECEAAAASYNAKKAADRYTWENTARTITEHIGTSDLLENPGEWVNPTPMRFLVRVKQRMQCSIGGTSYDLEPGLDYWLHSDVRRVLADAGALDPSCLEELEGRLVPA